MIDKINKALEAMESKFRTEDGLTICMYLGKMTFFKRSFNTQEQCLNFVLGGNNQELVNRH